MDIRKLQKIAVTALADIKAEDIEIINTRKLTALFDAIIVASGSSNRQVKALARNVHDKVKEAGGEVYGMEGGDTGEWVLVDLGDIVVHVMQPAVRAYYNLEELWRTAPKRAAESDEAGAPKPKQARTKKATTSTNEAPAKEAAAKPARKRAAASDDGAAPAPKKTTIKKTTTKKATIKKVPAKKASAPAKAAAAKPARKRKPAGSTS